MIKISRDKERYRVPRRVQDAIPIKRIWPDGIFLVGNRFTKTWKFTDINYLVASKDDKETMFFDYCEFLNGLDSAAESKITISNHFMRRSDFEDAVLMKPLGDGRDVYRTEYNEIIKGCAKDSNGIVQDKYITVSIRKPGIEEARVYFSRVETDFSQKLAALGSKCVSLDANERLRALHGFYRSGEENYYSFDIDAAARRGHDFKDYICPDSMEKNADHLMLGGRYARVLYLKDYATYIKDDFIAELMDIQRNMMLSIDIVPVPRDEAIRIVQTKVLEVETGAANWQRRQNQNNNFSAILPYDMELQRRETHEFLNDLMDRDQRMMFGIITIVITSDTKEELDQDTERILSIARSRTCQIATLRYQQLDGLNTVLPIGARKLKCFRTLTTESLAVFIPFKVQEIMDKGGVFLGVNAVSHNLILINKELLINQSALILGIPGSGKSVIAKIFVLFYILSGMDDLMICDPEGEYARLVEALAPEEASIVHLSAGGADRLNAMLMVDDYGEGNAIASKAEFILSLVEQIDKDGVGPQHKSIIDRCISAVYKECYEKDVESTLCTLRDKLLQQPEPEAKQIALALELYTTGSLDIFGHESNIDLDKRIIVFDISALGAQLKQAGLLVITDTMLNRVSLNAQRGKRTHLFIDEFHVVYENEYSAQFFSSAWRQFRKRNAYPTAITQNVEYLLDSIQASTMLSNSELVVMLNQAASDRDKLAELLNISNEQMSYITNSEPGCGLIKYGGALVPFVCRIPKNTRLYKLMSTRPSERY